MADTARLQSFTDGDLGLGYIQGEMNIKLDAVVDFCIKFTRLHKYFSLGYFKYFGWSGHKPEGNSLSTTSNRSSTVNRSLWTYSISYEFAARPPLWNWFHELVKNVWIEYDNWWNREKPHLMWHVTREIQHSCTVETSDMQQHLIPNSEHYYLERAQKNGMRWASVTLPVILLHYLFAIFEFSLDSHYSIGKSHALAQVCACARNWLLCSHFDSHWWRWRGNKYECQ